MEDNKSSSAAISLPKGGGAIKGIGETFQPDLFTGTGNFSIPIPSSPGRQGFGPKLSLQYSSGYGNGPFGLGWQLSIPRVSRKTEKGLPKYDDSDIFILSGAEDLVPVDTCEDQGQGCKITRYQPRTEGLFARIEKWESSHGTHWRAITRGNVTSIYGKTPQARVFDPAMPGDVFEWLLEETFDAKGNHIQYLYAADPSDLAILDKPYEYNRSYGRQRYIRRILYGNVPENLTEADGSSRSPARWGTHHLHPYEKLQRSYLFEVIFDYVKSDSPTAFQYPQLPEEKTNELADDNWQVRPDPFSVYRPFEIRTLRRCSRILMVHHFDEVGPNTLVKSTELKYLEDRFSLLESVTVRGHGKNKDGEPLAAEMPPVSFKYSKFEPERQRYQSIEARGGELPPFSLRNPDYALADLQGDALVDLLDTSAHTGFRYWRNQGEGLFDRPHPNHAYPYGISMSQPGVAFGDMGGDGLGDLVVESPLPGFYETTPDGDWRPFQKFDTDSYPSFSLSDPNVRLIDLTGDGRPDALMTKGDGFLWFECLGEQGYDEPRHVPRISDLEEFPDIYFDDPSGRVRLANMNGGLADIVLLHDGRVDYWPNLGRGRFGKRVTMANAPRIGYGFDPRRCFFADLDGSGCASIVYVEHDRIRYWLNHSGNHWSEERVIPGTPFTTDLTSLGFTDVFGTGTTAMLWSYDYGTVANGNYKALDFCGRDKPYLLTEIDNNLGATTRVSYAPSTKFYLEDLARGEPWVTNLPFPVHVVEKVEVIDHVSRTKLVTRYKYHHGYFDGHKDSREYRGFGRVDRFDTEYFNEFEKPGPDEPAELKNVSRAFHTPPVETRTWFHTGIYYDPDRFIDHRELTAKYREEYYRGDDRAFELGEQAFEQEDGTPGAGDAPREAYRALRGSVLRTEIYGCDGSDKAQHPYLVTENRYLVKRLRAPRDGIHGVYLTTREESISYHYERNPEDPRIAHDLTLATDAFGNVTDSVAIGYPRRVPEHPEQAERSVVYTKANFIHKVDEADWHWVGIPCQTRRYEVGSVAGTGPFLRPGDFDEIRIKSDDPLAPDDRLEFHEEEALRTAQAPCKRLIEWTRGYFRRDAAAAGLDEVGKLELGQVERLGLPYETYRATFTDTLIDGIFDPQEVTGAVLEKAGYLMDAACWWSPSGRQAFDPGAFYLPTDARDAFDNFSSIGYDKYCLLPIETIDPLQNCVLAENDYRVLQPYRITDANGNRTQVAFDALGLVAGTAVRGRIGEGDALIGFEADLDLQQIEDFLAQPRQPHPSNPGESEATPIVHDLLDNATTRIVYDLNRFMRTRLANRDDPSKWEPAFAATVARETHASDLPRDQRSKLQLSFSYSDGFGREIQKKVQAESGPLDVNDPWSPTANPRWVGSGWTVFNNKGKPVRQYEPFFSDTHDFEFDKEAGVSPILFYDPLERVVATLHPNRTYEKVIFDPWRQETWDVSDTLHPEPGVMAKEFTGDTPPWLDPVDDEHVGWCFRRLVEAGEKDEYWPTWFQRRTDPGLALEEWPHDRKRREAERIAARNALAHAATPTLTHLDSLGRAFLTQADNGLDQVGNPDYLNTHIRLDIQGNDRAITDPMEIEAFRHEVDMLGRKLGIESVDAGNKQVLLAADDKPVWSGDANGNRLRTEYDPLRRPTMTLITPPGAQGQKILAQAVIYGESLDTLLGRDASQPGNHRGKVYATLDGAGLALNLAYDFKGNLLASSRRLAKDYGQGNQAQNLREGTAHDWSAVPLDGSHRHMEDALSRLLEDECFVATSRFDALNRATRSTAPDHGACGIPLLPDRGWITSLVEWLKDETRTAPIAADGSVYGYAFNDAGLLETVKLDIKGERQGRPPGDSFRTFVENIDYNEKGQRTRIEYGNGIFTDYEYCRETYRLLKLTSGGGELQDLHYTYDPAGNIAQIEDAAFPVVFHANQRVCPTSRYEYDSTYRLVRAFGREHQAMGPHLHTGNGKSQEIFINISQPINNGHALRNYIEEYGYDKSGNLTEIHHIAGRGSWTRTQTFATEEDPAARVNAPCSNATVGILAAIPSVPRSNRLLTSGTGSQPHSVIGHHHDANGNMVCMPHLPQLDWDHANQLRRVVLDHTASGSAWYTYDTGGQRVRKIIEKNGVRESERIYVGGFELWRELGHQSTARAKLDVMDGQQRIALVETETDAAGNSTVRIRYQLANHLGSAVMEVDDSANRISYEEFRPYGGTAYLAGDNWSEVESKRYRYSGKERDEETGLYYFGARFYAGHLGCWISCDRIFELNQINLFQHAANNPTNMVDPEGGKELPWFEAWENRRQPGVRKAKQEAIPQALRRVEVDKDLQMNLGKPRRGIERYEFVNASGELKIIEYEYTDRLVMYSKKGGAEAAKPELSATEPEVVLGSTYGTGKSGIVWTRTITAKRVHRISGGVLSEGAWRPNNAVTSVNLEVEALRYGAELEIEPEEFELSAEIRIGNVSTFLRHCEGGFCAELEASFGPQLGLEYESSEELKLRGGAAGGGGKLELTEQKKEELRNRVVDMLSASSGPGIPKGHPWTVGGTLEHRPVSLPK